MDKQIMELNSLRKYEVKMLVRLDKEFSDITYIPTSSLAMQIAELCKRNHQYRNPEDMLHNRPYYDHQQQIKDFDQSSLGNSKHLKDNPELLAKLQAEMERRKKTEVDSVEKRKRDTELRQQEQMQEKIRSVSVDPKAVQSMLKTNGSSQSNVHNAHEVLLMLKNNN